MTEPKTFSVSSVYQQLEQALREREVILETAGVGIVFVKQRRIFRCNQRYAEIFGQASALAMQGFSSIELYPDEPAFKQLGAEAYPVLASGQRFKTERLMKRRDGELFWCSLTGRLINPANAAEGSIWIVDDISEQKIAEAELLSVTSGQRLILDHAMVGIVFLRERQVTQCNRSFEELLGYAPGELDGSSSRQWYLSDEAWESAGLQCYAPFKAGKAFQGELLLRKKDGSPIFCEVRSKAIDQNNLALGSIWITMDISARKNAEAALVQAKQQLEQMVEQRTQQLKTSVQALEQKVKEQQASEARIQQLAHFDALTGLPNRVLLNDRSNQAIDIAKRNGDTLALLFLDLDHFKNVNDSLGHRFGDELLKELARRLKSAVREQDTVSRLGGDEFILVLPGTNADGAAHVANKVMELAAQSFQIEQHEITVTPSVGVALYPFDGLDFDALCRCADIAMYRAKQDGRNTYRFFTAEMQAESDRTLLLENALRRALERDQLTLHYQPQICMSSGRVIGAEALLRWWHPDLGCVSPAEFIPVAEASGLILQIGEWVMRTACRQLKAWMLDGIGGMGEITMAVNLSSVQFRHADLPALVSRILEESQLAPALLELELTEGVAMNDPHGAIAVMNDLHDRGIRMSIDDFGTGYSSLSYLKKFRVYKLKIDQQFVRDLSDDPEDRAIVSAIISMAKSLGLQTIAEGVESQGQLDFLREQGCNEVQGYFFAKPMPAEGFSRFVLERDEPTKQFMQSI
ncbi:sensor domain-containing protein [Roseateles oligotrophus]|uniref:EAL domain-containing protein n=1 Tax=Roseateles oligotrophus TaxID=1769250 RepID=A0ABT2YLM4_9BURK|nr:bifunctional diguanylate cyclase/phosphodiesterase [Roseateles oligotrophus]MCV2370949.1 EAL domain-containing protein [Roseateles oligotrophus]